MEKEGKDALTKAVKDRLKEFLKDKKLSEVSKITGCHYTVVHNISNGKYTPSLETIFQFKLGYGHEFDEVYIFTGRREKVHTVHDEVERLSIREGSKALQEQLTALQEKLREREEQISDLKRDKEFLQSLIKKQSELRP